MTFCKVPDNAESIAALPQAKQNAGLALAVQIYSENMNFLKSIHSIRTQFAAKLTLYVSYTEKLGSLASILNNMFLVFREILLSLSKSLPNTRHETKLN